MDRDYTDRFLQTLVVAPPQDAAEPKAILHDVYSAVIRGDFNALRAAVAEDVELIISGFAPFAGSWRGQEEVLKAIQANFANAKDQQPTMEGMVAGGDTVAVMLRETGAVADTGQPYNLRAVQWFTFKSGKIARIDQIVATL